MMKRILDIVSSIFILSIGILPSIVLAGLVYLDSGCPVFFVQKRVGKNRQLFNLYKFRTMRSLKGAENGQFDIGNKSRITGVGRFLRKTKLDELPQVINVIRGDMSIVGPRPEVEKWTLVYPERWTAVLKVRPGITDNASIVFRNEEEILARSNDPEDCYKNYVLPQKLDLYEQYVNKNSVIGDIGIILRTIQVVIMK